MRLQSRYARRRSGSTLVECAIIYPLTFMLILGMMVVGRGVYCYNMVAYLAREGARWASCHGGQYQTENATAITAKTLPNPTASYITTNIIQAASTGLDTTQMTVKINFNTPAYNATSVPAGQGSLDWDTAGDNTQSNGTQGHTRWPWTQDNTPGATHSWTNTVDVTVQYTWVPEYLKDLLPSSFTLQSKSVMPMCY